jgi:hypothetical protein
MLLCSRTTPEPTTAAIALAEAVVIGGEAGAEASAAAAAVTDGTEAVPDTTPVDVVADGISRVAAGASAS